MDVHPGPEKSRVSEEQLAKSDPIRRALRENEDWFRDLVEHSQDLLCIHDLDGRLLSVNPTPAQLLGYTVDEILQIPMRELVAPEFRPQFDAYLRQIERAGESRGFLMVMTRTGERRIWEYHNTLRTEGVASPIVRGIAHDITEQRQLVALKDELAGELAAMVRLHQLSTRLLASAELPALLEEVLQATIELQTADFGNVQIYNPQTRMLRIVAQRGFREDFLDYFRDVHQDSAACGRALQRGERVIIEDVQTDAAFEPHRNIAASAGYRGVQSTPLYSRSGQPLGIISTHFRQPHRPSERELRLTDLYARQAAEMIEIKQAEARLREYERVVEGVEDMIVVVDRDYRYLIANRAFLQYRDLTREQVIGHFASEIVDKEVLETIVKAKADECFQGKVVQYQLKYTYPKLGERDIRLTYFPIEGPTGEERIVSVMRDVTEKVKAEESLRRSEENYGLFVAQSSEGIFREEMEVPASIDLPEEEMVRRILYDAYIAECNDALAAMYGLSSCEELRGKRWREMAPPEDPYNIELTRQFVRSGFRVLDHVSHEVDIHGNPKVFLNSMIGTVENGKLVRTWGIQRDVTEKVKSEEARQKAEAALRQNVAQLEEVTEELRVAKEKLAEEKLYLEEAIDSELGFGEIIGRSSALKEVMQKVAKVAPSDATVLLLGETGTGKELVARAIHRMSQREGKSFIKLNCAAIPSGLLESELFGHEKGAFTGAVARKLGRLELADKGTLFLDEIGEIPLNLQPKLLRVLQDMEFERLGGTQTLKVNFRLLAATNRDLLESVKRREFRSDLYYRLNVFPILIPPLRERREDIRPLVEHFVHRFAHQMKKSLTSIPSKTMEMLVRWEWPGNIRELENFIERSVILSPGAVLQAPLSELEKAVDEGNGGKNVTLRDKERERILQVLRACKGKLGGPDGAAARLGLKRTTLQSKLDQLGIKPGAYRG
jgi:formate hydrogenlyase transcriptional activator